MSRLDSPVSGWATGWKLTAVLAGTVTALLMCVAFAPAAKADPVSYDFDHAVMNLGDLQGVAVIDPAADPPDPSATLTGDLTNGEFTAAPGDLDFPDKTLVIPGEDSPLPGTPLYIGTHIAALDNIAGNVDAAGNASIDIDISATVTIGLAPPPAAPVGTCTISPIPLALDTSTDLVDGTDPENPLTYTANKFTPYGAAGTTWEGLPASTPAEGLCPVVDGLTGGPGGLWMSGTSTGIYTGPPMPPVNFSRPVMTVTGSGDGHGFVGWHLQCNAGSWGGANQVLTTWTRDGVPFPNLANNGTTTKRTYRIEAGDLGTDIACYNTGKNPQGSTESDSSNSIKVIEKVPVVDSPPVLTTSNATENQTPATWNVGWQLRCDDMGTFSNPTGNPWIGRVRSWNVTGNGNNTTYVSNSGDIGNDVICSTTATNIYGSTMADSNAIEIE